MRTPISERQYAFFRAISAQGDQLLVVNPANQGTPGRWQDLETGQGYAAYLASKGRFRTVALDFDATKAGPDASVADAECALHLLSLAGIQAVTCASGSLGGRHVLFTVRGLGLNRRTAYELNDRLVKMGLTSLDCSNMSNPSTGAIRPPLAPRRQGHGRSRPLAPLDICLDVLSRGNPPEAVSILVEALAAPADRRPALRREADTGVETLREYDTASQALLGAATRAVNRGMSEEAFTAMVKLLPQNDPIVGHLERQGSAGRQRRAIARAWETAAAFVESRPVVAISRVPDEEVIQDWCRVDVGRLPASQGRIALVLLSLAVAYDRRLIWLSVRAAAECAGVSRSTAETSIQRLVDSRVIEVADGGSSGRARRFRLNPTSDWDPNSRRTVGIYPYRGGGGEPTVLTGFGAPDLANDVAAEVWSQQGLGEARRKVYRALVSATSTSTSDVVEVKYLAAVLEVTPQVVGRHLRMLEGAGLARRRGRSQWAPEVRDAVDLSFALGVAGVNAARTARHSRERRDEAIRRVTYRLKAKGIRPVVQVAFDPQSPWAIVAEDLGCGLIRTVDGVSGVSHRARPRGTLLAETSQAS